MRPIQKNGFRPYGDRRNGIHMHFGRLPSSFLLLLLGRANFLLNKKYEQKQ